MNNDWDTAYNPGSITVAQAMEERLRIQEAHRRGREERLGNFIVEPISDEVIRQNFPRWIHDQRNDYNHFLAPWGANRTIWICHNCGCFGYKYSTRELFKCYGCRSRNVQVCKSGDLSLLMRTSNIMPGVNMEQVYQARQERLRQRRRDERTIRDSVRERR